MAKISTYVVNASPSLSDKLIGTDVDDLSITKNFTLGDIASLIQSYIGVPTLEEVVTSGNTSTLPISLSTLTPSTITLLTIPRIGANQVAYADASGILDGESAFTYNASTNTLGVENVAVQGDISIEGKLIDGDATPGTLGQVLVSTGTATQWADINELVTEVLNQEATATSQVPASTDTPLQVTFGGAVSNSNITLSAGGLITFLQPGFYIVNVQGLFKRAGSSGGVAKVHFRGLINGVQAGATQGVDIDQVGIGIPYERSMPVKVTAPNTTLTFEILQDSAGVNAGGLYKETTTLAGWGDVPSAAIVINKVG